MHEMDKPLTRNRDDADLDAHLKAQEREGDPMLAFIKKKKSNKDAKKKGKFSQCYYAYILSKDFVVCAPNESFVIMEISHHLDLFMFLKHII